MLPSGIRPDSIGIEVLELPREGAGGTPVIKYHAERNSWSTLGSAVMDLTLACAILTGPRRLGGLLPPRNIVVVAIGEGAPDAAHAFRVSNRYSLDNYRCTWKVSVRFSDMVGRWFDKVAIKGTAADHFPPDLAFRVLAEVGRILQKYQMR